MLTRVSYPFTTEQSALAAIERLRKYYRIALRGSVAIMEFNPSVNAHVYLAKDPDTLIPKYSFYAHIGGMSGTGLNSAEVFSIFRQWGV